MEQVHYFGGWVEGAKSPWCQGFAGKQTYRTGGGARCIKVGTKVYKTGQTGTHTTSMLPISYQTTGNRLDLLNLVPLNFKLYRRWKSKNEVWGNFTVKWIVKELQGIKFFTNLCLFITYGIKKRTLTSQLLIGIHYFKIRYLDPACILISGWSPRCPYRSQPFPWWWWWFFPTSRQRSSRNKEKRSCVSWSNIRRRCIIIYQKSKVDVFDVKDFISS